MTACQVFCGHKAAAVVRIEARGKEFLDFGKRYLSIDEPFCEAEVLYILETFNRVLN